MIKEKPGLSSELGHVKRILHQQEDIHIIGDRHSGDKRSEDHTAGEMACCLRYIVDAFDSQIYQRAPG